MATDKIIQPTNLACVQSAKREKIQCHCKLSESMYSEPAYIVPIVHLFYLKTGWGSLH